MELVPVRGEDQVSALAGGDIGAFVGHHPYLEQGLSMYLPAVPTTPVISQEGYETALKVFGLSAVAFDQAVDNSFIMEE